MNKVNFQ